MERKRDGLVPIREAFTLRMFVPDGDPEGVRFIDRMNWTGLAARDRSTFSELRWYPPMEAAKGSLSWVFRAKQPESVRTGP